MPNERQLLIGMASASTIQALLELNAKKAIKFLSPHLVVKATRQGRWTERDSRQTCLVTFGRPNYAERQFVKRAQRAGEPFPVKKIQLKPVVA